MLFGYCVLCIVAKLQEVVSGSDYRYMYVSKDPACSVRFCTWGTSRKTGPMVNKA